MVKKLSFSEVLLKVKEVCSNFLKKHGGRADGYKTYIAGEVIKEYGFRALSWMTPSKHEDALHSLDIETVNTLGCDLYHEIHVLLLQTEFASIQFKTESNDDWVCVTRLVFLKNGGELFL